VLFRVLPVLRQHEDQQHRNQGNQKPGQLVLRTNPKLVADSRTRNARRPSNLCLRDAELCREPPSLMSVAFRLPVALLDLTDLRERFDSGRVDHKPTPVKGRCGARLPELGVVTVAVALETA
jgi:hypothetical protein